MVATAAMAGENQAAVQQGHAGAVPVDRIIVGLRPEAGTNRVSAAAPDRMRALAQRRGLGIRAESSISPTLQLVELEVALTGPDLDAALARLAGDPEVAFAEPDQRAYPHAVPVDALYSGQWYLQGSQPAALDAETAWNQATGSAATVVAVLDTGARFDHPDLLQAGRGGRLLPGYDFVSRDPDGRSRLANDGDGWDANPADPGDWITASEAGLAVFSDCEVSNSSWHGTRVAGLIGAIANNGVGIAGTTWSTWILPVRVLGKCYGRTSDILQGMRWAAGLPVSGAPANPYPARIINLSLGSPGTCTQSYLSVMNELTQAGILVVASAGNVGGPVEYPANCPGAVGVAGLRHIGTKVGYSSLGPTVALAAPGGNCVNLSGPCLFSLDTTDDLGRTEPVGPGYTSQLSINVGTSFSAPFVAGIAALMHAVNGNLRGAQVTARLREGARPFPAPPDGVPLCHVPVSSADIQDSECGCTTSTCGAGMAYAPGALTAALRPIAAVAVPLSVAPGQNISLDASGSAAACLRNVVSYQWTPVSGAPAIGGADTAVATVVAPAGASAFTVRVTVTDDHGAVDAADITVTSSAATTTAPAAAGTTACPTAIAPADPGAFVDDGPSASTGGGGGGGGGAPGPAELLLLLAALARRALRGAVNPTRQAESSEHR